MNDPAKDAVTNNSNETPDNSGVGNNTPVIDASTTQESKPPEDVLLSFGTPQSAVNAVAPQSTLIPPSEQPTPATFTQTVDAPRKPKKFIKVFLMLFCFIIILVVVCAGIVSYAIAYEKLDIPKYPKVKAAVTQAVMSIPFMPKTPKYLIAKTLIAHEKVTKHDYNISMSVDSPSFSSIAGMSRIDIETKGAIDYEDPKNVIFTMDASVTKDFNIELRKPNNLLYFKINKVPSFLLAMLGLQVSQLDPVMNKWVSYDTTPLETEASKELQKDTEVTNLSEEVIGDLEEKYLTEMIVKKLTAEKVTEDGNSFYKLSLDFDKETLDEIEKSLQKENGSTLYSTESPNLSDVIKKMNWSLYINTKTYLTHKISVTSEMEVDQISPSYGSAFLGTGDAITQNSKVNFAFVLKFDKFGEEVKIETPTEVMTFEEFTNNFSEIMQKFYGSLMSPAMSQANDDLRKSDLSRLKIILELYKADCGSYPTDLNALVTPPSTCKNAKNYIAELPKDPTGSQYYYKPNAGDGYDLCTNLDTPILPETTCPDPAYNHHVTFP